MYYEGGSSSVYCWELDGSETAFAACVLFKKEVEVKKKGLDSGGWDAIHVAECRPDGKRAAYKLTSTIMLRMSTDHTSAPGARRVTPFAPIQSTVIRRGGLIARRALLRLDGRAQPLGQHDATDRADAPRRRRRVAPHQYGADGAARAAWRAGSARFRALRIWEVCVWPRWQVEDMENRMRDSLQAVYFGKTKSVVNGVYKVGGAAQEAAKDALAQNLRDEMARRAGS